MACVLVVDDEPSVTSLPAYFFRLRGCKILTASPGEEALTVLGQRTADIVLLDVEMPGMGGIATLRRIRELKPRLPVIIVSWPSDVEKVMAALDAGATDYVSKPFNFGYLETVISTVMLQPERYDS